MLLKENDRIRDITNVTEWHRQGLSGKGIHVVIFDTKSSVHEHMKRYAYAPFCQEDRISHGTNVAQCIYQMANNVKITMLYSNDENREYFKKIAHTVDIVNISMSAIKPHAEHSWGFLEAYNIPVLCSSGNDSNDNVSYPSRFAWTISVGAYDWQRNIVTSYSNQGERLDMLSPTNIYVQGSNNTFNFNGTSASSPCATGTLACYLQWRKDNNLPKLSAEQVRQFIHNNTIDLYTEGFDTKSGYGLFILPSRIPTIKPTQPQPEREISDLPEGYPQAKVIYNNQIVKGIIINGQTMLQLRDLSALLKLQISYNSSTKQVTFNNQIVQPTIIKGRSYMHIREVSDMLGLKISWNNITKTVVLRK